MAFTKDDKEFVVEAIETAIKASEKRTGKKLGGLEKRLDGKLEKLATKDDLKFHFTNLDQTLSETRQRVRRLEEQHPDLPAFKPVKAN